MTDPAPTSDRPTAGRRATIPVVIALVVGLGVGLGAAFLLAGGDDEARTPAATTGTTRDADPDALAELPAPDEVVAPSAATDPEAALRGFLAAEVAGEWETSYEFLADDVRETVFPAVGAWVNNHADVPTVTGYRIDDVAVDEEAGTAEVASLVGFDPVLDPVIGLVPARARVTWALERTDDGVWRVDTQGSSAPAMLYPGSEGAAETARSWVDARIACEEPGELEARLIGAPSQADLLCSEAQPDEVEIGPIGPLQDSSDASALLSEYGAEVFAWARTARVEAATPITVVLGPLGEEWKVVGVLPAR